MDFFNVPCDLYIQKGWIEFMEEGEAGIGYASLPPHFNKDSYTLVPKYAFQPITNKNVLDFNTYDVVFIGK